MTLHMNHIELLTSVNPGNACLRLHERVHIVVPVLARRRLAVPKQCERVGRQSHAGLPVVVPWSTFRCWCVAGYLVAFVLVFVVCGNCLHGGVGEGLYMWDWDAS